MISLYAILGVILLIIFLLIAIRIGVNREKMEPEPVNPVIHKSGIYSIVRRSPRSHVAGYKPSEEALIKYLSEQNVDIKGKNLSKSEKENLLRRWKEALEANICEIEAGDRDGVEFYIYDYAGPDPVCEKVITRGCFVSREQIFKYPMIIPPFHLGCSCCLKRYRGDENLRDQSDTAVSRIQCLFNGTGLPTLPDWKNIVA